MQNLLDFPHFWFRSVKPPGHSGISVLEEDTRTHIQRFSSQSKKSFFLDGTENQNMPDPSLLQEFHYPKTFHGTAAEESNAILEQFGNLVSFLSLHLDTPS